MKQIAPTIHGAALEASQQTFLRSALLFNLVLITLDGCFLYEIKKYIYRVMFNLNQSPHNWTNSVKAVRLNQVFRYLTLHTFSLVHFEMLDLFLSLLKNARSLTFNKTRFLTYMFLPVWICFSKPNISFWCESIGKQTDQFINIFLQITSSKSNDSKMPY